jgi:hypothetical protein
MEKLISLACRLLFLGSFVLAGLAVWERVANMMGYTLLQQYSAGRLLELSALALVFVIALQLRAIKLSLEKQVPEV